jgi:drug/metabolite transporter (DMT)-like permease
MKLKNWYIFLIIFLILDWLFPIFSYFALQSMSTLWLVAFSVWISLLFWLIIFIKEKLYFQYKNKELLLPTLLSVFFMWIWWLLYFFWIKYSSPSIAAILLLLQSLFAFIIFNLIWKENYNFKQIIWAIIMFLWWIIILYNWDSFINIWALIMVIAAIFWTIWNFFTKKASLKWANPFFLLINRNIFMVFISSILAYIFVWEPNYELVKENFIWIFLIWFLVLFIWKSAWIIALKKLDSFVAISSFPIIPLLVIIFSYFILWKSLDTQQIIWFIPIFIGSYLLIK